MQPVNYFFASIASFLGLFAGFVLIKIAPEEQKPLQKYFDLLRKIILFLIFAFLIFYYYGDWLYFIVLISLIAFLLLIEYKLKNHAILTYAILGILFYLSSRNISLFAIESSLIFLYGLPTASLIHDKGKSKHKLFLYGIIFVAISNILFLTISRS